MNTSIRALLVCIAASLTTACDPNEPKLPDLPKQPDRWISSVVLDTDSVATYIGKTKDYAMTTVTEIHNLDGLKTIKVGDEIEGVRIGAIKCLFFWRDASYGGEQFMWRGRWSCMAGRNRQEVLSAVGTNGEKLFDYIHLSPVTISEGD